jgi:hydroxymethylpyrimidine pyrophosphatase-like HAD family hydrolase
MQRKIAFFDIDGTLTSEVDGSIPASAIRSIREARANGHLMFINTGRCFQNVEQRFRDIGFDGYVCGCGTNIYCDGRVIYS